ncbi:hypothetical protein Tco_1510059 [Tanacetum coccineum]
MATKPKIDAALVLNVDQTDYREKSGPSLYLDISSKTRHSATVFNYARFQARPTENTSKVDADMPVVLNSTSKALLEEHKFLGYGTQLNEMSDKSKTDTDISMSVFEVKSSDEESTPANDRFSKADGYHVVPPPITRNFQTPRSAYQLQFR